MTFSKAEMLVAPAKDVAVSEDTLTVDLSDGRTISVPVAWFPRLVHGTPVERQNWRLVGQDEGIHWPDLDEDIEVEHLLAGYPSGESNESLKQCLEQQQAAATTSKRNTKTGVRTKAKARSSRRSILGHERV